MLREIANKRRLSYLCNAFDDRNLTYLEIRSPSDREIIDTTIEFFKTESKLIYPYKSYFVALVYAKCMEKFFNQPFFLALNDKELLIQDPWFIPYKKAKNIYDSILKELDLDILSYLSTEKTVKYFKQEFLVKG